MRELNTAKSDRIAFEIVIDTSSDPNFQYKTAGNLCLFPKSPALDVERLVSLQGYDLSQIITWTPRKTEKGSKKMLMPDCNVKTALEIYSDLVGPVT